MLFRISISKPFSAAFLGAALLLLAPVADQAAAQAQNGATDAPLDLRAPKPAIKPVAKITVSGKPAPKPRAGAKVSPNVSAASPSHEKTLLESAKIVAAPANVPDFVRESRPPDEKIDYMPIGRPVAEPSSTPLTRDQIKAREAELDSIRYRHDAMSKRAPAPVATKSVAGEPVKPKKIKLTGGK